MAWTLFDEREHFDSVDVTTIRRHVREWVSDVVQLEQQPEDTGIAPVGLDRSPRYSFCIQGDAEAFDSVLHDAAPPLNFDRDRQSWVKLKLIQQDRLLDNPRLAA